MSSKNASITADQLPALTDEIILLRQEVEVLRNVLDELRENVVWGIRNGILPSPDLFKPLHVTSLPLDSCADDFHERVNAVSRDDLPDEVLTQRPSNEDRPHEEGRDDARQHSQTSIQKGRQQSFLDADSDSISPSST